MLQIAPSKTDAERLLLVSPELAEVLTAIIYRVRAGNAALPLVSAYDVFEQTWSAPMPFLFQRRYGSEDRPITRSYIRECMVSTSQAAQITVAGEPLEWRPHDFRRIFVTDALRSGLPPHIAAKICGHTVLDTTMGYAAIYPQDVISHHRAFIARRRAERPSEEYRELNAAEWDEFLAHFELRKVALGVCGRDYGTPCAHENACFSELRHLYQVVRFSHYRSGAALLGTMSGNAGRPSWTASPWRRRAAWIWASLSSVPARLTLRPSISPSQPSRSASAMRSCRLARISSSRPRWAGSGLRSEHLTQA